MTIKPDEFDALAVQIETICSKLRISETETFTAFI